MDTTFMSLEANYNITDRLGLNLMVDKNLVESNDLRAEYDRSLASLSVTMRL